MKASEIKTWKDATEYITKIDKKDFNKIINETLKETWDSLDDEEKDITNDVRESIISKINGLGELGFLELMAATNDYFKRGHRGRKHR